MIALLENGNYLSTVKLVDPTRCQITRSDIPEENAAITEQVRRGLETDFTTVDATLMQVSCMQQEERFDGQPGFEKFHGILDLMALEEANILQNFNTQAAQGEVINDPWQLRDIGFTFHHTLFRQAVDKVAVTPIDWEQVGTRENGRYTGKRVFLYTKNFTSTIGFSRMLDPQDNKRYGAEGYQISTLVDCGDVVLPAAQAGIMNRTRFQR